MSDPGSTEPNELVFALCHEVGNLLAASRMQANLLTGAEDAASATRAAGTISQLASQMGSLISLIRAILTQPTGSPESLDPLDVLDELQRSVDESCEDRVRFNLRSAVDLPRAVIEGDALHHVLLIAVYSGLEDSGPSGIVSVSAASNSDELTFIVEAEGPDWQSGGALRGRMLAQIVADAVIGARGGRTRVYHRDGSNCVEFTVPTA